MKTLILSLADQQADLQQVCGKANVASWQGQGCRARDSTSPTQATVVLWRATARRRKSIRRLRRRCRQPDSSRKFPHDRTSFAAGAIRRCQRSHPGAYESMGDRHTAVAVRSQRPPISPEASSRGSRDFLNICGTKAG